MESATAAARYDSVADVAAAYGVSRRTVERAIAAGRVPAITVGRAVRLRRVDWERAMVRPYRSTPSMSPTARAARRDNRVPSTA